MTIFVIALVVAIVGFWLTRRSLNADVGTTSYGIGGGVRDSRESDSGAEKIDEASLLVPTQQVVNTEPVVEQTPIKPVAKKTARINTKTKVAKKQPRKRK